MSERPSKRHGNIIKARARFGYNEDQLARHLDITRETMRGWAKMDEGFARALEEALTISLEYWVGVEQAVHERGPQLRRKRAKRKSPKPDAKTRFVDLLRQRDDIAAGLAAAEWRIEHERRKRQREGQARIDRMNGAQERR